MPTLSGRRISRSFARSDAASNADERGAILEELLIYIMRRIPGVRLQEHAVLTANGSEELDLVFWNDRVKGDLPFLPWIILVECKNWSHPVGSDEVGFFCMKAQERHLEFAILVAANGITGDGSLRRAANLTIDTAFVSPAKLHLIVITRGELMQLRSTDEFVVLLQNKISRIVMRLPLV
jgi:hypothetical protein